MMQKALKRNHLYEQLTELLRREIDENSFPSGKLPTEPELARIHGVSLITVRKALSCLADEGIILRRRGSGTFIRSRQPEQTASSRRTRLLCYLSGTRNESIVGNFFNRLMLGAQKAAELHEYSPILASSKEGELPMPLVRRKVDGVIFSATFHPEELSVDEATPEVVRTANNAYLNSIVETGYPVVAISNYTDCRGVHRVNPDYEQGILIAVRHLLEHGHRRIGMVAGNPAWPAQAERLAAFQKAKAELGLDASERLLLKHSQPPYEDTRSFVEQLRVFISGDAGSPTALIQGAGGPYLGMQAAETAGLRVPEDISIVALSDNPPPKDGDPVNPDPDTRIQSGMTALEIPVNGMAEAAVERLMKLIDRHQFSPGERDILVPLRFHPGETVGMVREEQK